MGECDEWERCDGREGCDGWECEGVMSGRVRCEGGGVMSGRGVMSVDVM